ncbi:alanine--tRNA ligase [Leptolyngbya sp. FACHB-36]|uniref:alanine--tRNA ligase n=1 Tax=Leptolyngbya sp. FACHB-36 TaxID=2692808 RepID=UPI00167FEC60|nr:alanine--tRNA ligase [Leptolyngbya sp. FACHB-36]MBD2019814.1 alanine--tRNA ligase [Leptolyngbya sp. FACHB-36]
MAIPKTGADIRQAFLDFYAVREHEVLPSASLVPEDPTVLLTIAGMLPFKPIFLGQRPAEFPRATTSQKCIRTNDIENVGRTARHHTFFEMLGNFSFGDYFKSQAIAWAWELSTKVFGLPPERLVVSVFEDDDEAFALWRDEIGIPAHRIQRMGEKDNFWVSGPTGPCGPCSEIYYDFKPELGDDAIDLEDDSRFLEFYNLVFMQYNRDAEGNLTPLASQNIDTGMGLDRMAQILQQVPNNYETDLIFPIIEKAAAIANVDYATADEATQVALKVIGDHTRAVVHMLADGIVASNEGRGYVLRRLIRRVIRYGRLIGIEREFTPIVAEMAIALGESAYPNVRKMERVIKVSLQREEVSFLKTLDRGERILSDIIEQVGPGGQLSGTDAFKLFDTYGFPLELTQEIAAEKNLTVDAGGFEAEMEKQRIRSQQAHETVDLTAQSTLDRLADHIEQTEFLGYTRSSSDAVLQVLMMDGKSVQQAEAGSEVQVVLDQTPFYAESGGQIGDRGYLSGDNVLVRVEDVKKESAFFVHFGRIERGTLHVGDSVVAQIDLACRRRVQAHHTATHLLQAALKRIVDDNISQAGSLVAFDRLRFDFNCPRALTPEEVQQVEDQVNTWIAEAHAAQISVMPLADAKARGAIAMFGEKYSSEVRVLDFPGVSMELCGGTHVANTAEIGLFKIVSETGVAAGIRRIEAVAGPAVLEYLNLRDGVVKELSDRFKVKPEEVVDRITTLQTELKTTQKQLETVKSQLALAKATQLLDAAEAVGEFQVLVASMDDADPDALKTAAEQLQQKLKNGAVVLGSAPAADKVSLVAAFSPAVIQKGVQAGKFIGAIAKLCGGGGGGRPNLAQAGGRDASKLPEALDQARQQLHTDLQ